MQRAAERAAARVRRAIMRLGAAVDSILPDRVPPKKNGKMDRDER